MAKRKDPLIWGALLIVIGTVFILENLDINAWDYVWKFWPVILIVWGATKLLDGLKSRTNLPAPPPPSEPRG